MSDIYVKLRDANIARQNEWDSDNRITLAYRGNELAGEVGEACNVIKKLERERLGIRGSRDTVQHLAEELADVVICADLIAMAEGIDLDAAVASKFNATSEKVGLATRLLNTRATTALSATDGRKQGLEEARCGDVGTNLCNACSQPIGDLTQYPGCGGPLTNLTTQPTPSPDALLREARDELHDGDGVPLKHAREIIARIDQYLKAGEA